jgi:hypothetical protein
MAYSEWLIVGTNSKPSHFFACAIRYTPLAPLDE